DDGATQRSTKLVPLERGGIGFSVSIPVGVVEVIPGVQCAVPQVLEKGSVPLIRAGCGHDRDLATRPFAVLGSIRIAEDVVFPHGVHAEQLLAGSLRRYVLAG